MSDWLVSLEGTTAGHDLALMLALGAAVLHAIFGALQKGRADPWLSRAAIDACYGLIALPVALFVVPWPEPHLWPILAGVFVIHAIYKLLQAAAYDRGAYMVVYPVVRGMGPLVTVILAGLVFGEDFAPGQWLGVALLSGGILALAGWNWQLAARTGGTGSLGPALGFAALTGVMVAAYTTYDAWGIRATADPFTFLAWFFVVDSPLIPALTHRRWRALPRSDILSLLRRGVTGALVAFASFGAIMLATRLDKVGEAAVLRETSTVFAALIGWLMLGERPGVVPVILMALVATGAVMVEFWG